MALVKWDPFRELEEMSDRLNRMIARPSINSGGGQGKEVMTVAVLGGIMLVTSIVLWWFIGLTE